MTNRIEQAARVLFEGAAYGTWDDAEDWQKAIYRGHAHDLAKAGLLATCEEWGTRQEDEPEYVGVLPRFNKHTAEADINQYPEAVYTLYRRFVTEWEAVE